MQIRQVALDSIVVLPERQRRVFDEKALDELEQSIRVDGLHQPLVIRIENDKNILVAGERRLRVLKRINILSPQAFVNVVDKGELDPLQRERVELEENIIREDLTWQERASALARLHNLRVSEEALKGNVQTRADTSREVFGYAGAGAAKIKDAIMLQQHFDDPAVSDAKSETEAMNVIKKKMAEEFSTILAARVKTENTPHTLIHGDCTQQLLLLMPESFDVIITDPPFGIDAHKMHALSGSEAGTTHDYDDTLENAMKIWQAIFKNGWYLCKPEAAIYFFYDFRHHALLHEMAKAAGWTVWPTPLIWHKPTGGMLGDSTHGPRKSYECILFAYKGDKRTTGMFLDVVIDNPQSSFTHAAAKPASLYANLLRRSCIPGMQVLDPCCGSGPIFPAANNLMLRATGIESVEKHFNTSKLRLTEKL